MSHLPAPNATLLLMINEGPPLESLTHRLAECPAEFLLPPNEINVLALVADHFRALHISPPTLTLSADPRELALIALVTWLLHDDFFLTRPDLAAPTHRLLTDGSLRQLAALTTADQITRDPDRREEFARHCLAKLSLRPQGETPAQSEDRFKTLDSVERDRVTKDTRAAEARARQIREKLAADAAREAAARYNPE